MIYVDSSVALAALLSEDRQSPPELWDQDLTSSRLLEYEIWNRLHARELGRSHASEAAELLTKLAFVELTPDVLKRALHAAIQAAEKGVPFMPLRGLIGSDILAHRPDWRVIDNPFGNDDPIVLLPAIKPDFALFHAAFADRAGNVFIGRDRELMTMAHAAARTIVTVEKLHEGNLLDDPLLSAGTVAGFYIETVVVAPRGAWPLQLLHHYPADVAHLAEYAKTAATAEGFARYLEQHVYAKKAA